MAHAELTGRTYGLDVDSAFWLNTGLVVEAQGHTAVCSSYADADGAESIFDLIAARPLPQSLASLPCLQATLRFGNIALARVVCEALAGSTTAVLDVEAFLRPVGFHLSPRLFARVRLTLSCSRSVKSSTSA